MNKIVFFRTDGDTKKFDIYMTYDISTNTWVIGVLPVTNMYGRCIISVNTIYIAGGNTRDNYYSPSTGVWKLEF